MSERARLIRKEYSEALERGDAEPLTGYAVRELNPLSDSEALDLADRLRGVEDEPPEVKEWVLSMFAGQALNRRRLQREKPQGELS